MPVVAKGITKIDGYILDRLKNIYGSGPIQALPDGGVLVPADLIVSSWRVSRLVSLGKLVPNNDGLFDGFSRRTPSRGGDYSSMPVGPCDICGKELVRSDPFVVDGTGVLKCIWCHDKFVRYVNSGEYRKQQENDHGQEA